MPVQILTNAWSFPQGGDRTVEQELFYGFFAQQLGIPTPVSKNVMGVFHQLVLMGKAENVLASALTLKGVQQLIRNLPLTVPINLMMGDWLDQPVGSSDEFYAELLRRFGPQPVDDFLPGNIGWVIVDPGLLEPQALAEMGKELKDRKVLIITKVGEQIPPELRLDSADYYPINILAPFAEPMLEQALLEMGADRYIVLGGGPRLLPTIIGVCDTMLQAVDGVEGRIENGVRQAISAQFVGYMPIRRSTFVDLCLFEDSWWPGAVTYRQTIAALLGSQGYSTTEIQPDPMNPFDASGNYKIVAHWQPA